MISKTDFRHKNKSFGRALKIAFLILLILLPFQRLDRSINNDTLSASSSPSRILDVVITNQFLAAGHVNNLSIVIVNKGTTSVPLRSVSLSIPPPLALMGKDDKWYFGGIGPGKNVTIEVAVFAPEDSLGSTYSASLELCYTTIYGDEETETRNISLPVHGLVDPWLLDVMFLPSPAVIHQSLMISGAIINEGEGTARALSISIVPEHPFIATEASSMFIGDVSSGAETPFSITCSVANVSTGTYPLSVIIHYKDDTNALGSKVTSLYVEVVEHAEESPGPVEPTRPGLPIVYILMIGLVGLGVGVALTFVLYRRRILKVPESH